MSRTACRQSSPSRIDRPYSLRACGNSAPPPSQGVTHRAHPCRDSTAPWLRQVPALSGFHSRLWPIVSRRAPLAVVSDTRASATLRQTNLAMPFPQPVAESFWLTYDQARR